MAITESTTKQKCAYEDWGERRDPLYTVGGNVN
jgi:hypothetical protein